MHRERAARRTSACSAPTTSTRWTCARCCDFHRDARRRRHRRRHPGAGRGDGPATASSSATRAAGDGLPREAGAPSPARPGRVSRRWASTSSRTEVLDPRRHRGRRRAPTRRTTSAATSCRAWSEGARVFAYDFSTNTIPEMNEERARLLARRRHDRRLLAGVRGPDLDHAGASTSTTRLADPLRLLPEPAGEVRVRRSRARSASASRPTRWCRRAASSAAATSTVRSWARACASTASRDVTESILFDGVEVGRHARIRRAIVDKGVRVPSGHGDRLRPRGRSPPLHVSEGGVVVDSEGHGAVERPRRRVRAPGSAPRHSPARRRDPRSHRPRTLPAARAFATATLPAAACVAAGPCAGIAMVPQPPCQQARRPCRLPRHRPAHSDDPASSGGFVPRDATRDGMRHRRQTARRSVSRPRRAVDARRRSRGRAPASVCRASGDSRRAPAPCA